MKMNTANSHNHYGYYLFVGKRMGLLIISIAMISQVVGCAINENTEEFDGYGYYRWGSNTYTIWNAPISTLNESDSQCVTKQTLTSVDFQIKKKLTIDCLEVEKLHHDKGNLFKEILHSFFHSQTGMYFFASLLELL